MIRFLQTTAVPDSLKTIDLDLAAIAEKIATTPTNELLGELLDKAVSFGL